MKQVKWNYVAVAVMSAALCGANTVAHAQSSAPESPWSAEVGIGWDNDLSGNINSSAIGELDGQTVVILKNTYEHVYGTGLHLKFGGGYMLNETDELRASLSFQSLDADYVTPLGDLGVSNLYGQYTDYQALTLEVGFRRYANLRPMLRAYGEGTIGLGFVDKIDVTLVAPGANLAAKSTDFYDQTAAFTMGGNVGLLIETSPRIGFFGQVGLRYVTGLSEVDDLVGTGLESINDKSSRWTAPLIFGVRTRF